MVARKTVCLRQLGGDRAGEERIGRFCGNDKATAAKIVASWSDRIGAAAASRHVLAIQDTTEVKYPTRAGRRRGLGPLNLHTGGVLAHVMVGVDANSGACLGLVGGEAWNRPGLVTTHHKHRLLAERESRRWLDTAQHAKAVLAGAATVTVTGDRENDIYPKWAGVPAPNLHLLIRGMVDR
jgi:hypothetical protein